MVLDESMNDSVMNDRANALPQGALLPQLALMPLGNDYFSNPGFEGNGRQDEGLPSDLFPVVYFDDEDGDEEEDMDEDESFDDMDEDFDDDFDDDEDEEDFDNDDYEEEDEDYDYEEDVDYDDFDE